MPATDLVLQISILQIFTYLKVITIKMIKPIKMIGFIILIVSKRDCILNKNIKIGLKSQVMPNLFRHPTCKVHNIMVTCPVRS